jgi:hypothetical protein
MFEIQRDGNDILALNVIVTCFGGGYDSGDNGQTESGVLNDGSDPNLLGCALPIRSTEAATKGSPLACATKPHIPWGTLVRFWRADMPESTGITVKLIDNGPDVKKYPSHAGDLTVAAAAHFWPNTSRCLLPNNFEMRLNYRVIGAVPYTSLS